MQDQHNTENKPNRTTKHSKIWVHLHLKNIMQSKNSQAMEINCNFKTVSLSTVISVQFFNMKSIKISLLRPWQQREKWGSWPGKKQRDELHTNLSKYDIKLKIISGIVFPCLKNLISSTFWVRRLSVVYVVYVLIPLWRLIILKVSMKIILKSEFIPTP